MRRVLGHNIMTVEDLIDQLKQFDPTYEVGVNMKKLMGFSIKEFRTDDENGVLDIGIQMSYDPVLGFIEYDDFGKPLNLPTKEEILGDDAS